FAADDGGLGLHQIDAVGEDLASLGGVHQSGADAQFGTGQHRGHQFRAVLDIHHHGVAFLQPDGGEVVGDAVGPGVELPVGEFGVLVNNGDAVGVGGGGGLEFDP